MSGCRPGTGRMYGQSAEGFAPCGPLGNRSVCSQCGGQGCAACGYFASHWRGGMCNQDYRQDQPPYGPQGAQVAYPYYTTRGPRDFLIDNPPSIGN